jgi:hypothetical protein
MTLLTVVWTVLILGVGGLLIGLLIVRGAAISAWERSPAGMLHQEAMGSWLLAKARLDAATPVAAPSVVRVGYIGRMVGRRSRRVFVREERRPMHLRLHLLPIGGAEVITEGVVTVPAVELGDLRTGLFFSVLYDPRDPRRFYVDTMRRDAILMDAVTMRTQAAEENHRAALAFSPPAGQGYR